MLGLPTILLMGDVVLLGVAVLLGSPVVGIAASMPAGLVAVVACELLARAPKRQPTPEPWRLDAWSVGVGTLGVLGVGASVGPQAVGVVWLLVALIAGLGFASMPRQS